MRVKQRKREAKTCYARISVGCSGGGGGGGGVGPFLFMFISFWRRWSKYSSTHEPPLQTSRQHNTSTSELTSEFDSQTALFYVHASRSINT